MANVVNYLWPITGLVAPTVAQLNGCNEVKAQAVIDGTGTTVTITHNLGISVADLANGFPDISIVGQSVHAADGTSAAYVSSITTNTIVLTFITAVAGTYLVTIKRPTSLER